MSATLALLCALAPWLPTAQAAGEEPTAARPNILFIAVDDLNDWVGVLGGHPQARTPNLDRLARSGVLFTNAYCDAPACNPSRTAVFTGIQPNRSGLYANPQPMRLILPDEVILPQHLRANGYRAAGSGKLLHYFIDAPSWDEYFPPKERENPLPRTLYPAQRPVSLPREPWQYVETDWAALDATDEEFGGDWLVSGWIADELAREHEQPFFLGCGIYRPHEPWYVPEKYFAPFPLDEVQLPPGLKEGDLEDVPAAGQLLARNRYLPHIQAHGQWRPAVQAYLASIHYADAMVGRVLDALAAGPNANNTIVCLWSDHGWHLGEKEHWQKYTGWRVCARVPLMMVVPSGTPGLPTGTTAGGVCARPVNLSSLFSTLTDLTGVPRKPAASQLSLVPLLRNPAAAWPHAAITHLDRDGDFAVSTERWRYLHYRRDGGGEELYDLAADPYEWTNLAGDEGHAARLAAMRALAPTDFTPRIDVGPDLRTVRPTKRLELQPLEPNEAPPASEPGGERTVVLIVNRRDEPIRLHWIDTEGERVTYDRPLPSRASRRMFTRAGHTWLVTDEAGVALGYAVADREPGRLRIE